MDKIFKFEYVRYISTGRTKLSDTVEGVKPIYKGRCIMCGKEYTQSRLMLFHLVKRHRLKDVFHGSRLTDDTYNMILAGKTQIPIVVKYRGKRKPKVKM